MKKKRLLTKKWLLAAVCLLLTIGAAICFISFHRMTQMLPAEQAAVRWQGENDRSFSQVDCFFADSELLTKEQIFTFREDMMKKLHEAALDIDNEDVLFSDCWSAQGKVNVSTSLGTGSVAVFGVGGNFFDFHPIDLLSGCYIRPDDLMDDRVMLDEETAWLLFGSIDVQGQGMKIEGNEFVVSGVIRREEDFASKAAWGEGRGIFMSYDALVAITEKEGVSCYQVVLPQPVKEFAVTAVREKLPIKSAEIVDVDMRFDFWEMLKTPKQLPERLMRKSNIVLPYWENAARYTELCAAALLYLGLVLLLLPLVCALVALTGLFKRGKTRLDEDILPVWKDNVQESIRVRQRRRWEKKHPGMWTESQALPDKKRRIGKHEPAKPDVSADETGEDYDEF